jgi:hypothetical protein
MPRKSQKKRTDRQSAHLRAEKAGKYASGIAPELVEKAKQGNLTKKEFQKAVQALRKILSDSHLTGITSTTPRIRVDSLNRSSIIVKVSISTAKTRKEFSIRRGL